MISFIIPAHSEALWIGKCLGSIRASMEKLGEPYELIVVDDASTPDRPLGGRLFPLLLSGGLPCHRIHVASC